MKGAAQEMDCCLLERMGVGQRVGAVVGLVWVEVGGGVPARDQKGMEIGHWVEAGG